MTRRDLARNGAQLAGLWAVAVAQPLFDLIDSGEVFVRAGWRGGDVVAFTVLAAFLIPALMLGLEALVGRFGDRAGSRLHVVFVGGLAGIFAAYVVKLNTDWGGEVATAVSLVAAGLAALGFRRLEAIRSFTTLLGAASVLFPLLFLFNSPVRHLVLPADGAEHAGPRPSAPVVLIILDEFPTLSMLDRRGELDRRSFPAFASLADDGIWFRNATTVADFTTAAVPAILTGRRPTDVRPASISAHPDNLLAFLGRRGGLEGYEDRGVTRLCPGDVCPGSRPDGLPGRFTHALRSLAKLSFAPWLPRGAYQRLPGTNPFKNPPVDAELARFGTRPGAAIHYIHLQLPHTPWYGTPSGKHYRQDVVDPRDFEAEERIPLKAGFDPHAAFIWRTDERRLTTVRQRHLAQARYTDLVLGQILARLRRSGLYDRSMVVVTADHGMAFEPGVDARRLEDANAPGVMFVPLFVKPPRSGRGATSDRFVQSIDVAPTVADAVGVELPWKTDGRSALAAGPDRRRLEAHAVESDKELEFDAVPLARRLREAAARQGELFAGNDPDRIFRTGPYRDTIGRRAEDLPSGAPTGLRHALRAPTAAELDLKPKQFVIPALVGGTLEGPNAIGRELMLAVNGRLVAAARSREPGGRFEALLPDRAFRTGVNELRIYAVEPGPGGPRLAEIPPAAAP